MNPNLITLTASDLRGCDSTIRGVGQRIGEIMWSDFQYCYVVQKSIICAHERGQFVAATIQCHPTDYIRAWLGPVGELFPYAENAQIISGGIMFSETDSLTGYPKEISFLSCPAALASAMGSSVWRRTDKGWEVVE